MQPCATLSLVVGILVCFIPFSVTEGQPLPHKLQKALDISDPDCGGERSSEVGTILSPNYPQHYPGRKLCVWRITTGIGRKIKITFNQFHLMGCKDYVSVYEAKGDSALLLGDGKLCNSRKPFNIQSKTNEVFVVFKSNKKGSAQGFNATYSASGCGVPVIGPNPWSRLAAGFGRIVGGNDARPGSWPWQVSIRSWVSGKNHFCGGTLVDKQWVVTAAHCVDNGRKPYLTFGEFDRYHYDNTEKTIFTEEIFIHPGYNNSLLTNDVAVLKLTSPVTYTAYVYPICLPDASMEAEVGTVCTVTGWGSHREGGTTANRLLQANIPIVDSTDCSEKYARLTQQGKGVHAIHPESMVCAGYPEGGVDSCQGDSGGPLVCKSSTGAHWLQGVVSWGYGCARADAPGVYARVPSLADWIRVTMETNS
ncbi:chymotrypsinogen A-like isoform X1 [Branchiostoma lanceolatum]|uniref:chymotrypsinogen A-like isoform X1 n=2 Tax=Branchiostoma lanceolatum TaxID=7740 RepID=UPI003455AFE1